MPNFPPTLRAWLQANGEKIAEADTFAEAGTRTSAYDILLAKGWITADGTHVVFESTARAVLRQLRRLKPCACERCRP